MSNQINVRPARPGETNYEFIDVFTLHHMMMGTVMGAAGFSALQALGTTIAWELVEPTLKRTYPDMFPSHTIDTVSNKVGDTTYWMMGWLLGYALRRETDSD